MHKCWKLQDGTSYGQVYITDDSLRAEDSEIRAYALMV